MLIVLFLAINVLSALIWHRHVSRYLVASIAAAVTAVAIYQAGVAISENFNSPYALLGVVVTFPIALIVALLVGIPFRKRRLDNVGERHAV